MAKDAVAPTVTIDQASSQADPTSNSTIHFTAIFSEPVTGVTGDAISLSGTAGATTATVTEVAPNDGTTYDVAVSGMTVNGTVTASVLAGAVSDPAGNSNAASSSTDSTVTWVPDTVAPGTTIDSTPSNPSSVASASFTFSGTDAGSGVASFECKLDAGSFSACSSPKSYSGLSDGSHTFQVRAIDGGGNVDASPASFTWLIDTVADPGGGDDPGTVDTVAPSVAINQASGQADPSSDSTVHFTAVFSEAVTGFSGSDVSVSGTAGATTALVTGSGTTYDVAISGMTTNGTVVASIPAGAAVDGASNGNTASSSTDNTITYSVDSGSVDNTPPDITLSGKKKQELGKSVKVGVRSDEACTAVAKGKLVAEGRAFKLKKATGSVLAGDKKVLKPKVPKRARNAGNEALEDGEKVVAKLRVSCTDAAGNVDRAQRKVKLTA